MVQMPNSPSQRLLRHILCIFPVGQLPKTECEHPPLKLLHEGAQPLGVSCQAAFDEFPVVHRAVHLSLERDTRAGHDRFQPGSSQATSQDYHGPMCNQQPGGR